jgi:hypothetical protein
LIATSSGKEQKVGLLSKDASAKGDENILDAVSLPVNRLAFDCIQSLGYRKVVGYLPALSVLKSYILAAEGGIKMGFPS